MKHLISICGCFLFMFIIMFQGCIETYPEGTFGYDVALLKTQFETIILSAGESHIAVVGDLQGRIMTSSAAGSSGRTYGWINREFLTSENEKTNADRYGGEDRLWFGPEYGKFSIFFEPGAEMIAENVKIPAPIDTEPFELLGQSMTTATFAKGIRLTNYQNFDFEIDVEREVSILSRKQVEEELEITVPSRLLYVGFQSKNTVTNRGDNWSRESGLLSIWNLGAFPPTATVIIPIKGATQDVTSYWSQVEEDRLKMKDGIVYYKGDGAYRHKIGIQPLSTVPLFGSYDMDEEILTIVKFSFSGDSTYVNSMWVEQEDPYGGDVINVYNEGLIEEPGKTFYELESSSHSTELQNGEQITHVHATFHFEGDSEELNKIAEKIFGVKLEEIEQAF